MRQIVDDYSRQEVDRVFFPFPEISAIKSSNYGITNKYIYNNPWFYKRPSIEKSQTRYERVSRVKRDKFLLKVKEKKKKRIKRTLGWAKFSPKSPRASPETFVHSGTRMKGDEDGVFGGQYRGAAIKYIERGGTIENAKGSLPA